jgi:hypothetical protein
VVDSKKPFAWYTLHDPFGVALHSSPQKINMSDVFFTRHLTGPFLERVGEELCGYRASESKEFIDS